MSPPSALRAAIYRRVSTTEQEANTSPEHQEKQCREYAARYRYTVVADEFDVHTGAKLDSRRGLNAIRAMVRERAVDVVVVWRLDRLTRRMWDLPKLLDEAEQHGVAIASVTEQIDTSTPVGKMTAMALAFVAEQERETFRQRSEAGRRIRAERGKPLVGPRPTYGYRWVEGAPTRRGTRDKIALEPDPVTAPVVVRIFEELAAGASQRSVCVRLTEDGIPTSTGKERWDKSTIQRLLRQSAYWGQPASYRHRWSEESRIDPLTGLTRVVKVVSPQDEARRVALTTEVVPPLVSPEIAAAALARAATNNQAAPRRNLRPEDYLLRGGFVRCGHCGRVMTCRLQRNRRTGRERLQYRCTTQGSAPGACVNNSIEAGSLDREIWAWVETVLRDPELVAREVRRMSDDNTDPATVRKATLERRSQEIERQRAKLAQAVATLDDEEASAPLLAELQNLAAQSRAVREELATVEEERKHWEAAQSALKHLTDWCATVTSNVEALTHAEKQLALSALDVAVTVWKPGMHEHRWQARMRPLDHIARMLVPAASNGKAEAQGEAVCTTGDIRVRMSPGSTQ